MLKTCLRIEYVVPTRKDNLFLNRIRSERQLLRKFLTIYSKKLIYINIVKCCVVSSDLLTRCPKRNAPFPIFSLLTSSDNPVHVGGKGVMKALRLSLPLGEFSGGSSAEKTPRVETEMRQLTKLFSSRFYDFRRHGAFSKLFSVYSPFQIDSIRILVFEAELVLYRTL